MRVICDAPGQTCNRLWTYVTSVARCVAEHRRMVIIFYDWTIEDFPNLLHCPFIYFPLWQKWYLERGITDKHILGVLVQVDRDGKVLDMRSPKMRIYGLLQWFCYPLRACWLIGRSVPGAILRRIRRYKAKHHATT